MDLNDASPVPFWLDRPLPAPTEPLEGRVEADPAIVGGGFTGLWAALQAKTERPGREVVLLEAGSVGWGASGRNGGFVEASLTHGLPNGAERVPRELELLEALGRENLAGMKADIARLGIDAHWEKPGSALRRPPTYLGAVLQRTGTALADPGALAQGLRRAAIDHGVRIYEQTPVPTPLRAQLRTPHGAPSRSAQSSAPPFGGTTARASLIAATSSTTTASP